MPQVVFIGGAPLAGKTCLARFLAQRLGATHISTDDLSVHHLDGLFRDYYRGQSAEQLMEDAMAVHREVWPAIEAAAARDGPAVIEGWSVLPEYVSRLAVANMRAVFLVPNEEVFEHRCRANAAFYEGAPDEEALIRGFVQRSVLFSRHVDASATKLGLPVVRSTDESTTARVLDLLA